jgi:hypothetical protein
MNINRLIVAFAALLLASAASGSAQARYLCDAPPTPRDARACEAARQGPGELRHFVQRMQSIENLQFSDYVDDATAAAWEARDQRRTLQTAKRSTTPEQGAEQR